jgi:hypothetical protein
MYLFLLQLKSAAELKTEHDSGAVPEKEYFTKLQKLIVPKVTSFSCCMQIIEQWLAEGSKLSAITLPSTEHLPNSRGRLRLTDSLKCFRKIPYRTRLIEAKTFAYTWKVVTWRTVERLVCCMYLFPTLDFIQYRTVSSEFFCDCALV